jgi:hypothetical protein
VIDALVRAPAEAWARVRARGRRALRRDALLGVLRRPWPAALAAYAAIFVAVTWPMAARLNSATYGGPGDGWALIWQTWFRHEHGLTFFSPARNLDLAWPFGTESASAVLLSNAATELPNQLMLALGVPDVAAYNLLVIGVVVASSMAMYGVARRFGCPPEVAFWAGLVYLLAPWHLDRAAIHPTLALMAALPLLALGIVEWIRRPGLGSGALVVGATALAVYSHVYYALFAGMVLVLSLPVALAVAGRRRQLRAMAARTAALGGALAVVALPLALALALQRSEVDLQLARPLYLADLAAQTHLYLLPAVGNPVFGDMSAGYLAARGLVPNTGELALYLGWITILLAVVGLGAVALGRAPRLPVAAAVVMCVVGLVFAAPARVTLPLTGEVRGPVSYLQEQVDFISTPARFFALTLTGVTLLAALGMAAVVRRLPSRALRLAVVAALALLSSLELMIGPDDRVVATAAPPVVRAVERHVPADAALAQYPSADRSLRPVADQLFWQVFHGRPLLNGASVGTVEDFVRREVSQPTDPSVPGELALLGFGWATYEPAAYAFLAGGIDEAYGYVPPAGFETVEKLSDGSRLMRVTATAAPGIGVRARGFHAEGGRPGFLWMDGARASLLVCATARGSFRLRSQGFAFAVDRRLRIGPRSVVALPAGDQPRPFSARVDLEPGWQWVPLRLTGSLPARPADIVPGSDDRRELSVSLTGFRVEGPRGDPAACRTPPPAAPA